MEIGGDSSMFQRYAESALETALGEKGGTACHPEHRMQSRVFSFAQSEEEADWLRMKRTLLGTQVART